MPFFAAYLKDAWGTLKEILKEASPLCSKQTSSARRMLRRQVLVTCESADYGEAYPSIHFVGKRVIVIMKWNGTPERWPMKGKVEADRSTKQLLQRIRPGSIAVIAHDDLDELAVRGLIAAKVKAVINTGKTTTGTFASRAGLLLLDAGLPLLETAPEFFELLSGTPELVITENGIDLAMPSFPAKDSPDKCGWRLIVPHEKRSPFGSGNLSTTRSGMPIKRKIG